MDNIIKVKFKVGTKFVGSDVEEIVEYNTEGMTKEEVYKMIEEDFETWVWENIDSGFIFL